MAVKEFIGQLWYILIYTEFILVKLQTYRHTSESIPGTNRYLAMRLKFLAQGNNGLPLTRFELMRLAIIRLLSQSVYGSEPCHHYDCLDIHANMHTKYDKWVGQQQFM
jgi:hypothetical protein